MPQIKVYGKLEHTVQAEKGTLLSDILKGCGAPPDMPCGGRHTCGKCRVRAYGSLSAVAAEERRLLSEEDLRRGIRLACLARAEGDAVIFLESPGKAVIAGIGELPALPRELSGFGAAVDIGTTTIAAAAFAPGGCTPCAEILEKNAQAFAGADVISRIDYCGENGVSSLSDVIRKQIADILEGLAETCGARPEDFSLAITGNTTMLHLLCGLDPKSLAVYPFETLSLFGESVSAGSMGLPGGNVYLPRCLSAYLGADLTCAVLASGMVEKNETALLADIGTNGEMALISGGRLTCCSTAAGPAFEGAGISSGMSAVDGAIDKVGLNGGEIVYTVIGGGRAKGICGSGLVDAVAAFLKLGLLDETGRIPDGDRLPVGDSGILLTQEDIRKVQLAKAAVCAGMETLCAEARVPLEDLSVLYLAGGFGSFLNPKSAARIGLIPKGLENKVRCIGNAALTGAAMLLLAPSFGRSPLAAREINLSLNSFFMDQYISRMLFE